MVTPGTLTTLNKPEISELFELPPGVDKKVGFQADQKQTNAGVFTIWLEDHTVGNALRNQLLRDEHVLFGGYKIPHPLENKFELRVQTSAGSQPSTAARRACAALAEEVGRVQNAY